VPITKDSFEFFESIADTAKELPSQVLNTQVKFILWHGLTVIVRTYRLIGTECGRSEKLTAALGRRVQKDGRNFIAPSTIGVSIPDSGNAASYPAGWYRAQLS